MSWSRRAQGAAVALVLGLLMTPPGGASPSLSPALARATITVTSSGLSAPALGAVQAAAAIWSSLLSSPVPISVSAHLVPLPPGLLALAHSDFYRDFAGAPFAGTWYPVALANRLSGRDLNGADPEIRLDVNAGVANWYLGLDGKPSPSQYDLETAALHELGHALGFDSSTSVAAGVGRWGAEGYPYVYDRFVQTGAGARLLDATAFPNPSPQLAGALQSGDLVWGGPAGTTANGGRRPPLHAPPVWDPVSSVDHLSARAYPPGSANSLMTPVLRPGEAQHAPGPIALAMLSDMGWT